MNAGDLGLLALRVGIGGAVAAHGAQKLFGRIGGAGLERTGATFERLGFRPGKLNAIATVWAKPAAVRYWRSGSALPAPPLPWLGR